MEERKREKRIRRGEFDSVNPNNEVNSAAYKELLRQVKFSNGEWPSDYD